MGTLTMMSFLPLPRAKDLPLWTLTLMMPPRTLMMMSFLPLPRAKDLPLWTPTMRTLPERVYCDHQIASMKHVLAQSVHILNQSYRILEHLGALLFISPKEFV